ncbi:dual specificity protein phosphatase 18-like [Pungitius pungitius]|uniref:dual specificity protein phosphatase 18-like n=1 Tax=Pungitius pungitius TaxID=134920 RepID=UPI002E0EE3D4
MHCHGLCAVHPTSPPRRSTPQPGRSTPPMHQSGLAGLSGLCRVTDHLYLSNARAASDSSQVTRCEISCIVNATETKSRRPLHPGVEYVHVPVSDSPASPLDSHFDEVADRIQRTAARGGRTLVHCNAGVSRSASLCMAYLMKHRGVPLLEAHQWVRSCRPVVRPNNGFWKQLIRYEVELRGCASIRMVSSSMGEVPDIYEQEARNMMPL